jgi:hypothetical protein
MWSFSLIFVCVVTAVGRLALFATPVIGAAWDDRFGRLTCLTRCSMRAADLTTEASSAASPRTSQGGLMSLFSILPSSAARGGVQSATPWRRPRLGGLWRPVGRARRDDGADLGGGSDPKTAACARARGGVDRAAALVAKRPRVRTRGMRWTPY